MCRVRTPPIRPLQVFANELRRVFENDPASGPEEVWSFWLSTFFVGPLFLVGFAAWGKSQGTSQLLLGSPFLVGFREEPKGGPSSGTNTLSHS